MPSELCIFDYTFIFQNKCMQMKNLILTRKFQSYVIEIANSFFLNLSTKIAISIDKH